MYFLKVMLFVMPGPIEQSLTKVSNGAKIRNRYNQVPHLSLISYTGVMGLIQAQPHTFMENELKWVEQEKMFCLRVCNLPAPLQRQVR